MKSDRRAIEVGLTEKGEDIRSSLITIIQETIREESALQDEDFRDILQMIIRRKSEA
jgi:DNA-binding MarR family transcriptional regulator